MSEPQQSRSTRPSIRIEGEHEIGNGWLYTFTVEWANAAPTDHELTLSWVEQEHLVRGTVTPSALAQIAAQIEAEHFGAQAMPARCDVSILRRRIPGFDERVRGR